MARLSLGDFGNAIAQSSTPTQVASGFDGVYQGGMNALQMLSNLNENERAQKEADIQELRILQNEKFEDKTRELKQEAENIADIERKQAMELNADVHQWVNESEANFEQAQQMVEKGELPPEQFKSYLNDLNSTARANIETKWSDTSLIDAAKNQLDVFGGGIANKALAKENEFVKNSILAEGSRSLDLILSADVFDSDTKMQMAEEVINKLPILPVQKQQQIEGMQALVREGYWTKKISQETSIDELKKNVSRIESLPINDKEAASLLITNQNRINKLEAEEEARKREIDYQSRNEMVLIADMMQKGVTVEPEQLEFFAQNIKNDMYLKNGATKKLYSDLLNAYQPIQAMKKFTVGENQNNINELKKAARASTGEEARKLEAQANLMQNSLNKLKSDLYNDGITKYSIDTNTVIPEFNINDPDSIARLAKYTEEAEAKYGMPISMFTAQQQASISEQFKYMSTNQVANIIANIGENTKNDATLNSITKQADNKQYYRYAANILKNNPTSVAGRSVINGGRLLDNVDGHGVVIGDIVRDELFEDFEQQYGEFFKGNLQAMGTFKDTLRYAYANELGKGSDTKPVSYDKKLGRSAMDTLFVSGDVNGVNTILPDSYRGRESEFEDDVRENIIKIFGDDLGGQKIARGITLVPSGGSDLDPDQTGYDVLYGGDSLLNPNTKKPIKIEIVK